MHGGGAGFRNHVCAVAKRVVREDIIVPLGTVSARARVKKVEHLLKHRSFVYADPMNVRVRPVRGYLLTDVVLEKVHVRERSYLQGHRAGLVHLVVEGFQHWPVDGSGRVPEAHPAEAHRFGCHCGVYIIRSWISGLTYLLASLRSRCVEDGEAEGETRVQR